MAFTSFLTGITEPLEFLFMFEAPLLYLIHAILTGLALAVSQFLDIHHGFGFSAGFFDYIINYKLTQKPLLIIPLGAIFAIIYSIVSYYANKLFNCTISDDIVDDTAGQQVPTRRTYRTISTSKPRDERNRCVGAANS